MPLEPNNISTLLTTTPLFTESFNNSICFLISHLHLDSLRSLTLSLLSSDAPTFSLPFLSVRGGLHLLENYSPLSVKLYQFL